MSMDLARGTEDVAIYPQFVFEHDVKMRRIPNDVREEICSKLKAANKGV